jgi:hypothetical protein
MRFGWYRDLRRRRKVLLFTYGALVVAFGLGTLSAVVDTWVDTNLSLPDRLAEMGDWASAGILALAALAALVALQAYAFSTGLPDLTFQVLFGSAEPNQPVFDAEEEAEGSIIKGTRDVNKVLGRIIVNNASGYSARNPAVVIRLNNMSIAPGEYAAVDAWTVVEGPESVTAIQWDGGSDYSIHGGSKRQLPPFYLASLAWGRDSGEPSITIELLAENYKRTKDVPVDFTINDQRQAERNPRNAPLWL